MKGRLEDEQIKEEIRQRNDIVDVISESVSLIRRGKNYVGLCPFHQEKTPSFTVYSEQQRYYCFGCEESGDVFKFIMEKERVDFKEALQILAARVGIQLVSQERITPEERQRQEKTRRLQDIHEIACCFFQENLTNASEGDASRRYLIKRSITEEIVQKFRLGFAPNRWDGLLTYLQQKGFTSEELLESGLISKKNNRNTYYDRFRNRLIFPICDVLGKVIAFGGRVLDDEIPKYLNSPEISIFSKGNHLYGLNIAKEAIRHQKRAVLVEGYMDVLSGFQCGITNIIASMGTALTDRQAALLKRYAQEVIVAYDADGAGMKAAQRGIEIFQNAGLQLKIAILPKGMDPDDLCRQYGIKGFENVLKRAYLPTTYQIKQILGQFKSDTIEGKMHIMHEVLPILSNIKDHVLKEEYVNKLARRLEVTPQAIYKDLEKYSINSQEKRLNMDEFRQKRHNNNGFSKKKQSNSLRNTSMQEIAQKDLLRIILMNPEPMMAFVKRELSIEEFSDSKYRKLALWLWEKDLKNIEAEQVSQICDDSDIRTMINDLLLQLPYYENEKTREKALFDYIDKIRIGSNDKKIKEKREELVTKERNGASEEEITNLLLVIQELQNKNKIRN